MVNLYSPQMTSLPFHIVNRLAENKISKEGRQKKHILYISAKPDQFSFIPNHYATTEFSKQKINYLMNKGHSVIGAYASTVREFIDVWNYIGHGILKEIDKVIIDYHGAISPKRGYESVIVISQTELLDKNNISMLQIKSSVKIVSLYSCYGGFVERYNPSIGFLQKINNYNSHSVGFDAQGDNDIGLMKTIQHSDAGDQFRNALININVTRQQYGRVRYSNTGDGEIIIQHGSGNIRESLSKYMSA